jgi:hypothetical protein
MISDRTLRKFPERGVYAASAFLKQPSGISGGLRLDTLKRAKAPRSFICGSAALRRIADLQPPKHVS